MKRLTRGELLNEIKKYFIIQELVGKLIYKIFRNTAWKYLDDDLLEALLIIRVNLNRSITVNNWSSGGKFSQRGLRDISQQLVKNAFYKKGFYLSSHLFGKGVDFDVKGMSAVEVREWIMLNQHLFPVKIRLERNLRGKPITWVHLDTIWEDKNPKVYQFDV